MHVAAKAASWNQNGNVGLVVGATRPKELSAVRAAAPDLPFLIPGVGAQGGDLEASVREGTDTGGEQAVINSSRGILYASSGADFAEAARLETRKLRDAVNAVRAGKK
jgi:orotidine-5'-phosphate decarboxylase